MSESNNISIVLIIKKELSSWVNVSFVLLNLNLRHNQYLQKKKNILQLYHHFMIDYEKDEKNCSNMVLVC